MKLKSSIWLFQHISFSVLLLLLQFIPLQLSANTGLAITPLIIDLNTEGRDIISETITLTNRTDRPLRLYASVHNISLSGAGEIEEFVSASMSDRTRTLTSWVEISRARLEVPSQGTLEVPVKIRINPNVEPGDYHGFIGFGAGHNRDVAEAAVLRGNSQGVIVRVSINQKRHEQLQLVGYTTDRFAALGGRQAVKFTLKNTGDTPLKPQGEIIIYDQRGREVNTLPVQLSNDELAPGATYDYVAELPAVERFGRHKAFLTLDYGARRATVHDATFFVSIPWFMLSIFGLAVVVMLLALFLVARSRTKIAYNDGVSEVGVLVRPRKSHINYDHDLNLKVDR